MGATISLFARSSYDINEIVALAAERAKPQGCIEGRIHRRIEYAGYNAEMLGNFVFCRADSFKIDYIVPYEKTILAQNESIYINAPMEGVFEKYAIIDTLNPKNPGAGLLDFGFSALDFFAQRYNFGFVYRGKIDKYDSVLVVEGRAKFAENLQVKKVMIWIDLFELKVLRIEGYDYADAILFILTEDKFETLEDYIVPVEYTLYLPAESAQGKIRTTLSALKILPPLRKGQNEGGSK